MDIEKLPKIDLHCHLDGSLALEMIKRHTNQEVTPQMLSVEADCRSLTDYLKKFSLPLACLQDIEGLKDGAYTFLMESAKDNIAYIEVRFAPMLSVHEHLPCSTVIESVLEGLEQAKRDCGVRYNVIACAMRHHTKKQNQRMLHVAREYLGSGVCAIDLAGDESQYPTEQFKELFNEARKLKMPFVIHSGETGCLENVRMAFSFGASRIGHGIALRQDRQLMAQLSMHGIGVEMCPTSNLQTRAVHSWNAYPLWDFVEAGIKVSVNTDNRTVSNTTVTKELQLIHDLYKSDELILQLLRNAQDTAFDRTLNLY